MLYLDMFTNITCSCHICHMSYIDIPNKGSMGEPLYYEGSPKDPNGADKYFCSAQCATKYFYGDKNEKECVDSKAD